MDASVSSLAGGNSGGTLPIPKKRLTYVLPPPSPDQPPPRLYLPSAPGAGRHPSRQGKGSSSPLIIPHQDQPSHSRTHSQRHTPTHPRHTLPVTGLAIDPSTSLLEGSSSKPRGIIYTAGRDGLTASWQLGLQMKKRRTRPGHPRRSSWTFGAALSGGYRGEDVDDDGDDDDDDDYDDDDDEWVFSERGAVDEHDGRKNVDGTAFATAEEEEPKGWSSLPFQRQWQVDERWLESQDRAAQEGKSKVLNPTFRSCVQSHTDWINDMVLCNQNQSVVTASSDRFVRVWNPHDPASCLSPSVLGSHSDYVKALAYPSPSTSFSSQSSNWIASGSLDQHIRLWDLKESRRDPIADIHDSASVYCLSTDARGGIIAVGTPEPGIRLYDSRMDSRTTGPAGLLLGHSDMVRALLLSASGRHLLSGSSDGTVRLWDVGEQRLVHTYTHHASSISALSSSAEDLDVFYSADRDGYLCKVDCEDCLEPDQGECVVLARCDGNVNKIATIDDAFVFTCGGESSDVQCWRDIPRRVKRQTTYPANQERRRKTDRESSLESITPGPQQRRTWATFGGGGLSGTPPSAFSSSPSRPPLAPSSSSFVNDSGSNLSRFPLPSALKGISSSNPLHAGTSSVQPTMGVPGAAYAGTHSRVSFSLDRHVESAHAPSPLSPDTLLEDHTDDPASHHSWREASSDSLPAPIPLVAGVSPSSTLFGVPFASLVCLSGDDDDAFGGLSTGLGTGMPPTSSGVGMGSMISLRNSSTFVGSSRDGFARRESSFSLGGRNSFAYEAHAGLTPAMAAVARLASVRMYTARAQSQEAQGHVIGQQGSRPRPTSVRSGTASIRFAHRKASSPLESEKGGLASSPMTGTAADWSDESDEEDEWVAARRAYERREVVNKASPLRSESVSTIKGSRGLLRSSLMNDRRHVLTFSSAAGGDDELMGRSQSGSPEVAIWDILRCICLGVFAGSDVLALSTEGDNPGDLLEKVKERIEGRGATNAWCSVDTKNGSLAVHLDWPSCFEAECYLDECHWVDMANHIKPDQRANLGKWVLRHLFDDFIQREIILRNGSPPALSTGLLAIERPQVLTEQPFRLSLNHNPKKGRGKFEPSDSTSPSHHPPTLSKIHTTNLNNNVNAQWSNIPTSSRSPHTPGNTLSIAVAPRSPAIGPPGASPLTPTLNTGFASIATMAEHLVVSPGGTVGAKAPASPSDYFSIGGDGRRPATPPVPDGGITPGGGSSTPGGGLIGRWGAKLRSKNSTSANDKAAGSHAKAGHGNEAMTVTPSTTDEVSGRNDPPSVALNRAILARVPLEPISLLEASAMRSDDGTEIMTEQIPPPGTAILISSASSDAAQWETVYRGLVASTAKDLPTLELVSPAWLLEFLLAHRTDPSTTPAVSRPGSIGGKMWFFLCPATKPTKVNGGSQGKSQEVGSTAKSEYEDDSWEVLPPLPSGEAKLSATKMLRVNKASIYLCEKLGYIDPHSNLSSRQGSIVGGSRRPSADAASGTATAGAASGGGGGLNRGHSSVLSMTKLQSALGPAASASASAAVPSSAASSTTHSHPSSPRPDYTPQLSSPFHPHSSTMGDPQTLSQLPPPKPEEIELLCNGVVLHPDTTLAQIARFFWKGPGAEPKLEYRLRRSKGKMEEGYTVPEAAE